MQKREIYVAQGRNEECLNRNLAKRARSYPAYLIDDKTLGSWKQAITSADGTWLTCVYFSKNGTFTVRNYLNGALLFYKHLCQKGKDDVIDEDLYKGTSKSMEGFAAREIMMQAKKEGMEIAIQWQDSDSYTSKTAKECFPNCKVMICGGHAGKNHLKALQSYAKLKFSSKDFVKRNEATFPLIGKVHCHCINYHKVGCGCLSDAFIKRARNNFSYILKNSQSPDEFAKRLRCLPRHACDEHKWVNEQGVEEHCDFHPLKICCGKCKDKADFQCSGKNYATRFKLECPFHCLMYEVECNYRA